MRSSAVIGIAGLSVIALTSWAATRPSDDRTADAVTVVSVPAPARASAAPSFRIASDSVAAQGVQASARTTAKALAASGTWWRPAVTDTWQWQLQGKITTSYAAKVYDIDLFTTPDAIFTTLHGLNRKILCYFSAGSSENFRDDFKDFPAADQGSALDGWPGERWINTRSTKIRTIMTKRLDLAVSRGCDGVEPDNVDGYANDNGLKLTASDQLDYNRFLATEAHKRGLAVALKNDLDQIPALVNSFDLAVNEQCNEFTECETLRPFIAAGKPVLNAEYKAKYRNNTNGARDQLCITAKAAKIRTLVLPLKLDGTSRFSCD